MIIMLQKVCLALLSTLVSLATVPAWASDSAAAHAIALHGEPKYGPGFTNFDFVNPGAPKGGNIRLAAIGTFDTLNPYTLKGVAASGLGLTYDTLTHNAEDEAFTEYGLIAETIEVAADHSSVTYQLRPQARFHDSSPVRVEDVIFSLETLKQKGHPFYRAYYADIETGEKIGERGVRFRFSGSENRELPLILGQMPVLPEHYWGSREFDRTTLEPPVSSGPYRIIAVDPGRSTTYQRVDDWWGQDLAVNVGRYNFDTIRYDYYRDSTVALQAFKAGEYDFRQENTSKNWATGYQGPALNEGLIKQEEIPNQMPTGMQGFLFNTRKAVFADPGVREALAYAFDFEWTNKALFYNAYSRTDSYFSNSELASSGLPSSQELEILEPWRGQLPEAVFEREYQPPAGDGSGNIRGNLRTATRLLREAGWEIRDGQLINRDNGSALRFEMLLVQPGFERVVLPLKKNLKRLGITMSVRTVDVSQYQKRLDNFDFDMIVMSIGQSLSPGNEQRDFWTSAKADEPGGRNYAGVRDPVVDALVDLVISAPDRASLIYRTQALDRVLLWGHYVIPNWHTRVFRVAYWNKFARPVIPPKYSLGFNTWWVDPAKLAVLAERKPAMQR